MTDYLKPKFTVPMPPAVKSWPFPFNRERVRVYCPCCDRPREFCDCPPVPAVKRAA